jgi:hypothetical protein
MLKGLKVRERQQPKLDHGRHGTEGLRRRERASALGGIEVRKRRDPLLDEERGAAVKGNPLRSKGKLRAKGDKASRYALNFDRRKDSKAPKTTQALKQKK